MFRWMPFAMVRVTLALVLGVIVGILWPAWAERWSLACATLVTTLYFLLFAVGRFRNGTTMGMLGLSSVLSIGALLVIVKNESKDPGHVINSRDTVTSYQVVVTKFPEERNKTWRTEGRIVKALYDRQWTETSARVLLYFSKREFAKAFAYGDVLLIRGSPILINSPLNPGEFDFKKFMGYRNIFHQHFVNLEDVRLIEHDPPRPFVNAAIKARLWADSRLKQFIIGEREQATVSALVLGVTDGLDSELLQAYASTGALHVLAVSGLHVSIIYWMILFIIKPLDRSPWGKWSLALISVVVLWAYAFVTGLSPSVLRAVTMFTFVAFARPWKQSTNIYNTLSASAFLLLLSDPLMIMSVGFQLSYIAVFGIVFLHQRLYRLWEPRNRLLDEIWKVSSVSISAQVATFPLGLFYFHQFPVYFLIANLIVIPMSFVVLVAGLAIPLLSFIPVLAGWLGHGLTWTVKVMNYCVFALESLPFSVVDQIHIDVWQCCLLFAGTIFLVLVFTLRRFRFVFYCLACVAVFSFLQWRRLLEEMTCARVTVYCIRGHLAIDLTQRTTAIFVADSVLENDSQKIKFHIQPGRLLSGVSKVEDDGGVIPAYGADGFRLIVWNGVSIMHITKRKVELPRNVVVDWLIIGNNAVGSLRSLTQIKFRKIILDSSNSQYFAERLLEEADHLKLDIYSVLHQGAFQSSLPVCQPLLIPFTRGQGSLR